MPRRPVRLTLSLTSEQYDLLCWLAVYWGEVPSTLAHTLMQEEIERRLAQSPALQAHYRIWVESKQQLVPGPIARKEHASERQDRQELQVNQLQAPDSPAGHSDLESARSRRRKPRS